MKTLGAKKVPRVFVALDYSSERDALCVVEKLTPDVCGLKIGKELFTSAGPGLVRRLVEKKFPVFLDLKFHDIPNTVSRAVAVAADLGVWMVNVHASGGRAMLEAANKSLQAYGAERPLLTAVTVLTSLSELELHEMGVQRCMMDQVSALSKMAAECGIDGVVCSAQEALQLRKERGNNFILVTPGIRLNDSSEGVKDDDQLRIVMPRQAITNGADFLIIGRPITQSADPFQILLTINEDISYIPS